MKRDPSYHNFAGGRSNLMNLVSNLALFIPAGYLIYRERTISLLSIHIIGLALTSMYYHTNPNDTTILPDMYFVISIYTLCLSYFVSPTVGIVVYLVGVLSVLYYEDIRFYQALKVIIPLVTAYLVYRGNTHIEYIFPILFLSVVVRLSEFNDREIYHATNNLLSGHSLKHITASITILLICHLLYKIRCK